MSLSLQKPDRRTRATLPEARCPADESEDQRERLFWARPEFADQLLAAGAHEASEHERDDDRVVELPRDGDEVRRETRGPRASLVTSTMQSGMNLASAWASSRRPRTTSQATNAV
jgi:hypothetical protein